MPHPLVPADGVAAPPRFMRSVVRRRADARPPVEPAVAELAAAHGYHEPQCPPGLDSRLWCFRHHRRMRLSGRHGNARLWCPHCAPVPSSKVVVGVLCAADRCRMAARCDVYGVPLCGGECLERIAAGTAVRPEHCPLRVIAYRSEIGFVILACFPRGQSVQLKWWMPFALSPETVRLRWPKLRRGRGQPHAAHVTDWVLAYWLRQLARVHVPFIMRPVVRAIIRWENRKGPCPWEPTTLQWVLSRVPPRRDPRRRQRGGAPQIQRSA